MVMLITCVVLRRLTDEVGFFRAESSSILCSLLFLGDEKEGRLSMGMKGVWKKINRDFGYTKIRKLSTGKGEVLRKSLDFINTPK